MTNQILPQTVAAFFVIEAARARFAAQVAKLNPFAANYNARYAGLLGAKRRAILAVSVMPRA